MKNKIIPLLLAGVIVTSGTFTSYANDTSGIAGELGEVTTSASTSVTKDSSSNSSSSSSSSGGILANQDIGRDILGVEPVSVDDLGSHLESKGSDIVALMKIIGQNVCYVSFIMCCIAIFFGIFGNKQLVSKAVFGAIISGISYAAIVYGEVLVVSIASWASS